MPADSIQLIIDYENGNIKQVSNEAETTLAKAGTKGGQSFFKNFNEKGGQFVLGSLKRIGVAAAAIGSVALFKSIKDAAALEKINTQFEVILKSSTLAQKQVQELQDFAATTPFRLEGLSRSTTQLLSFGVAQEQIIPTLRQLGDLAAGVGTEISELTIPFGRLVSTQKLTLIELDKFSDRGINLYAQLAKQTGRSLRTIRNDITRGVIPFEEFTKALNTLTGEGGTFFQATQKQAKTLTGVISTLGDNYQQLSASIGKAFSPIIIAVAEKIIKVFQDLNKQVKDNFDVFDDVITPLLNFNDAFITYVVAPFELLINIGKVAQTALNFVFARIISGLGNLGLGIAKFLDTLGIKKKLSEDLKAFEETSESVAETATKAYKDAFASVGDFSITNSLSEKNGELRTFFDEQNAIIDEQSAKTDVKTEAAIVKATEQSQTFARLLVDTFKGVQIGINQTKEQMAKVATQTAGIVRGGLAKGIAGGIQNVVTSLANGENAFKNFGKFILSTFGDLAIQLGTFFIAQGIAIEALNAVSGTGAIAAGAALIALGSILKSFSGGGAATPAAGGGAAAAPDFGPPDQPDGEALEEDSREAVSPTTSVVFNIDGNVKGDEEFIRDTVASIGEEAGKQGLVFNNFQTA